MTERQGRQLLGNAAGRSAAGGLVPRDVVNIIQSLGPSYNIGAFQGVAPSELIILSARTSTSARYSSLRLTLTSDGLLTGSGYTVPSGQQFIAGMVMYAGSSTASVGVVFGYADTSVDDAIGAPGVPVGLVPSLLLAVDTANKLHQFTMTFKVPAGKIPYMFGAGDAMRALVIGKLFPS